MKRILVLSIVALTTMLVGSGLVTAGGPPGLNGNAPSGLTGDEYECEGNATVIFGANGRSGWVNGELYQAVSVEGHGTFTPIGGDPEDFHFSKEWGNGPWGTTITCTSGDSGSDETGSWEWEQTVLAVKVPRVS